MAYSINSLSRETNGNDAVAAAAAAPPAQMEEEVVAEIEPRKTSIVMDPGISQDGEEKTDEVEEKIKKILMVRRSVFSLAWSIGDDRCYMISLQLFVCALCGFSLLLSYYQYEISSDDDEIDIICDKDSQYLGPYLRTLTDDTKHGCPWPLYNSIIRFIPSGFGLLSGIIIAFIQCCLGKRAMLQMDELNVTNRGDDKIEYFDIYSSWYFRFIRTIIGISAYLQFISFGFDLRSFLNAKIQGSLDNNNNNDKEYNQYINILYISLPVAILLRLSHDSMYQRLYKRKIGLDCSINWNSNKTYQGTTVTERNHDAGGVQLTLKANENL